MKSIKGTQTEKNLVTAFIGESTARNRYNFYSGRAKKDGFVELAALFLEIEDHERAHAKRLYKFLEGGTITVEVSQLTDKIGSTTENLKNAISSEEYEWKELYPLFVSIARDEGLESVAVVFEAIGAAEKYHAEMFQSFLDRIEAETVFKRSTEVRWRCRKCGFIYVGAEPPEMCPACAHPKTHFEVLKRE